MVPSTVPFSDRLFQRVLQAVALGVVVVMVALLGTLIWQAFPVIKQFGLRFIIGDQWDPITNNFGALPFMVGTVVTALTALVISLPFTFAIAVLLGEYLKAGWFSGIIRSGVELLAGIPSVIYGFWGLFVLVPIIRDLEIAFNITPYGIGIFTASLVVAVMIIPFAASLSRDVVALVPVDLKEAAYALGATRFEVVRYVVLPYARSGMFAGMLLALGRAVGETMAVTMVIGNSNILTHSIFDPGNTMASVIANEFTEATGSLHLASLIALALYLFVITAIMNGLGKWIINRFKVEARPV